MNTSCAVIILGHGTRRQEASLGFFALVDRIGRRLAPARVLPACFSCGSPTLAEQAAELARDRVTRIIIFPYFLLSGKHIADELPEVVQELREGFPQIHFDLLETMEDEPLLEAIVVTRLQGYVRECDCGSPDASAGSDDEIIAAHFATTGKPDDHFPFFRALALATGDLALAADIRVNGPVVRAFGDVMVSGKPLLCDTRELAAAVRSTGLEAVSVADEVDRLKGFFNDHLSQSIVVVGSDPLIIDTLLQIPHTPALVIALPPGFSNAPSIKQRLAQTSLTHITNLGTGGGISCALAVIRALHAAL